jgi:hypothetical protein
MRFQVPQFIEVEDKIFGPLTFKQFIYIAGSVGIAIVLFVFLPTFLAILISIPIVVFGAMLSFYRMNGKPFIEIVEAFIRYSLGGKLYLWQKEEKKPEHHEVGAGPAPEVYVPKLSDSKLKDLSWSLDIKNNQNPVTENQKTEDKL